MSQDQDSNETPNGPKVVELAPRDDLQAAAEASIRALPVLIEHAKRKAKLRRAEYLAYKAEGFTDAQALELCRHP